MQWPPKPCGVAHRHRTPDTEVAVARTDLPATLWPIGSAWSALRRRRPAGALVLGYHDVVAHDHHRSDPLTVLSTELRAHLRTLRAIGPGVSRVLASGNTP